MDYKEIRDILEKVKNQEIHPDIAVELLKDFSFQELEYAKIDHHRELRTGYPEIIFCQGACLEDISPSSR